VRGEGGIWFNCRTSSAYLVLCEKSEAAEVDVFLKKLLPGYAPYSYSEISPLTTSLVINADV
jgi:hypothetical protein